MSDSSVVVGRKISKLERETSLQQRDLLLFSQFDRISNDVEVYSHSKGIVYSNLSSQIYNTFSDQLLKDEDFKQNLYSILSSKLLNDESFISNMYQILSVKFINDEKFIWEISSRINPSPTPVTYGTIKYFSSYPE